MSLPGFDAESSIGPSKGIYGGRAVHSPGHGGMAAGLGHVHPQQLLGDGLGSILFGDCFGSFENCLETYCFGLVGQQRAKCFAACQKPSVCSDCFCSCSPNCIRTCQRECTKSTPSVFLRCRGSCFPFGDVFAQL